MSVLYGAHAEKLGDSVLIIRGPVFSLTSKEKEWGHQVKPVHGKLNTSIVMTLQLNRIASTTYGISSFLL